MIQPAVLVWVSPLSFLCRSAPWQPNHRKSKINYLMYHLWDLWRASCSFSNTTPSHGRGQPTARASLWNFIFSSITSKCCLENHGIVCVGRDLKDHPIFRLVGPRAFPGRRELCLWVLEETPGDALGQAVAVLGWSALARWPGWLSPADGTCGHSQCVFLPVHVHHQSCTWLSQNHGMLWFQMDFKDHPIPALVLSHAPPQRHHWMSNNGILFDINTVFGGIIWGLLWYCWSSSLGPRPQSRSERSCVFRTARGAPSRAPGCCVSHQPSHPDRLWVTLHPPGTCTCHRDCWIPSTPNSLHNP